MQDLVQIELHDIFQSGSQELIMLSFEKSHTCGINELRQTVTVRLLAYYNWPSNLQ